jgi:hypothetical protein
MLQQTVALKYNSRYIDQLPVRARSNDSKVSCQCRWDVDDGGMVGLQLFLDRYPTDTGQIQCYACHAWQHVVCYGYTSDEDPRIPEIFACNACLLEVCDSQPFEDLKDLAAMRNAGYIVLTTGYMGDAEFKATLRRCRTPDNYQYSIDRKQIAMQQERRDLQTGLL